MASTSEVGNIQGGAAFNGPRALGQVELGGRHVPGENWNVKF